MESRKVYVQGFKKVGPFTDKETGEVIEGMSVFYFDPSDSTDEREIGNCPVKTFIRDHDIMRHFEENGQGFYNLLLEIKISGNRPSMRVAGFEFLESVNISELLVG